MSATADKAAPAAAAVARVFHPTIQVPDLAAAEDFFAQAFGCASASLSTILPSKPSYPTEYSTFTMIRDVLIDSIDPKLHFVNGYQRYASVDAPSLKSIGWYSDDMEGLYRRLRSNGIRCIDLQDKVAEGDTPPQSPGGGVITYFTLAEDAGMQYQFMREGPFPLDPRTSPGWTLGPVVANDPLGVRCCSHHTILTRQPARALRFAVDALGGRVVHTGRNELLQASSTLVFVADALFEYAQPDEGSAAEAQLQARGPLDVYYAMTWKVADLAQVERHLDTLGVKIAQRSDHILVTEPASSLGVPWGFSTRWQPGDPRQEGL